PISTTAGTTTHADPTLSGAAGTVDQTAAANTDPTAHTGGTSDSLTGAVAQTHETTMQVTSAAAQPIGPTAGTVDPGAALAPTAGTTDALSAGGTSDPLAAAPHALTAVTDPVAAIAPSGT